MNVAIAGRSKDKPIDAYDWSDVFDFARECRRPIWAIVDGVLAKAFPSGRLEKVCHRCEGDGKAHGSDRPWVWTPEVGYPGPCPVCKGTGCEVNV